MILTCWPMNLGPPWGLPRDVIAFQCAGARLNLLQQGFQGVLGVPETGRAAMVAGCSMHQTSATLWKYHKIAGVAVAPNMDRFDTSPSTGVQYWPSGNWLVVLARKNISASGCIIRRGMENRNFVHPHLPTGNEIPKSVLVNPKGFRNSEQPPWLEKSWSQFTQKISLWRIHNECRSFPGASRVFHISTFTGLMVAPFHHPTSRPCHSAQGTCPTRSRSLHPSPRARLPNFCETLWLHQKIITDTVLYPLCGTLKDIPWNQRNRKWYQRCVCHHKTRGKTELTQWGASQMGLRQKSSSRPHVWGSV